jgi:hypothetical protein
LDAHHEAQSTYLQLHERMRQLCNTPTQLEDARVDSEHAMQMKQFLEGELAQRDAKNQQLLIVLQQLHL